MWILTVTSFILQILTCFHAYNLNKITGNNKAWWFLISSNFFIALRRIYSLYLFAYNNHKIDDIMEIISFCVSLSLFFGILYLKPLFLYIQTRQYTAIKLTKKNSDELQKQSLLKYNDLLLAYNTLKENEAILIVKNTALEKTILDSASEIIYHD